MIFLQAEVGVWIYLQIFGDFFFGFGVAAEEVIGGSEICADAVVVGETVAGGFEQFHGFGGLTDADVSAGEIVDPLDVVGLRLSAKALNILADGGIDGFGFAGVQDDVGQVRMFFLLLIQGARIPDAAEDADSGRYPEDCEDAFHSINWTPASDASSGLLRL